MQKPLLFKDSRLTVTQRRIVSLLASGNTFDEIASILNRTRAHIYNEVGLARNRCAVATTGQLIAVCVNDGEIVQSKVDTFITLDEATGRIRYASS